MHEPLSKAKLKLFTSLKAKKYRYKHKLFLIEGIKLCEEAIHSGQEIVATILSESQVKEISSRFSSPLPSPIYQLDDASYQRLCSMQSPEGIMMVIRMPSTIQRLPNLAASDLVSPGIILENIQDPGNLGTLIRTAAWFGITNIICTKGTVDVLNPKTLRGTMGSLFHTNIYYVEDIWPWIRANAQQIWLADMEGHPVHHMTFASEDWIVMGNEANGISAQMRAVPNIKRVCIPGEGKAESLNVGIAAGILMYKLYNDILWFNTL